MPFDFFRKSKPDPKSESLQESLGEDLSPEERAYLDRLEKKLKSDVDFENPAAVEAELRRREREGLEKSYKPHAPLYQSGNQQRPGEPKVVNGKSGGVPEKSTQEKSYQDDPRYREYFERLKREASPARPTANYDEEVKPASLEELDRQGWSSRPKPQSPPPRRSSSAPAAPARSVTPTPATRPQAPPSHAGASDDLQPGALVHLDDGSVAVYKDAVSGKDYALFYFLEPGGVLAPRGIFMEQYERQKIGQVPAPLLEQMLQRKRWERDAIIFHLDQYDFASFIPGAEGGTAQRRPATSSGSDSRPPTGGTRTPAPQERRPSTKSDVNDSRTGRSYSSSSGPRRDALLERGRVLRINVGGRVWESVYWTEDEMGAIVAHKTNKVWALMHLDLTRFKDSLEHGDVLSYDELSEIEQSLATQGQ